MKQPIPISIEAIINSQISKVWKYWTEPDHITKWNFADPSWQCPSAENDLRVGGQYKARMEAKDGSFGFDFIAIYNEVVDHKHFSYTMEDGRKSTTTFEDLGEQTKVTTTFDAEEENPVEMQKNGWQAILNNFKSYSEAN